MNNKEKKLSNANEDENKIFDKEVIERLIKVISVIAIPVVLAIGGWSIQNAISNRATNKDYVNLAVSILSKEAVGNDLDLRIWAVKLLNETSPVKLDGKAADKLSGGAVNLPNLTYNSAPYSYSGFEEEIKIFNRKAMDLINTGIARSPDTRSEKELTEDPSHYSHWKDGYLNLIDQVENLLVEAVIFNSKSNRKNPQLKNEIFKLLEDRDSSTCDYHIVNENENDKEFPLLVKNLIDLRCFVILWDIQHKSSPSKTMTSGDWQRRRRSLLEFIFAVRQPVTNGKDDLNSDSND